MSTFDWAIAIGPLILFIVIGFYTRRLMKSVVDFMAAGRCAGRFLIANARGEASSSVSTYASSFQQIWSAGFVLGWWSLILAPINALIAMSGFIFYRYRESRALTLSQFFEIRYSRKF